jgi:hypothetical protein
MILSNFFKPYLILLGFVYLKSSDFIWLKHKRNVNPLKRKRLPYNARDRPLGDLRVRGLTFRLGLRQKISE